MDWWRRVVCPVKKAWAAVASRVKARKAGAGILNLHHDVQTCGYQDVQVMWEILRKSEMEFSGASRRRQPLRRIFLFPNYQTA